MAHLLFSRRASRAQMGIYNRLLHLPRIGQVDWERPIRSFCAFPEDLSLEAVLEIFVRSQVTGLLVVESDSVDGELLWEGGRLCDASVIYPRRASGRRGLDYLLGVTSSPL
jgi:hypothetical protein